MFVLRPFAQRDLVAVRRIGRDALGEEYPASLYLDIQRWWEEGFLVAENQGTPIGFLAAVISAPGRARILMLAVDQAHRVQGTGTALMNRFFQQCGNRALQSIELEVRKSNHTAIRFYTRLGFQITELLPHFYSDGEDGYKMWRAL